MRDLLEAGVHFGHKTQRWNPKMRRYIFGVRNEIHIFDLQHTVRAIEEATAFLSGVVASGGRIVFVGTKRQAKDAIKECAEKSGQFYVIERWLGGTLTNFDTLKQRLQRLRELRVLSQSGEFESMSKRDALKLEVELVRLERKMGGMATMTALPSALVVVDPRREHIAVREARTIKIPVVGLTDSNCDPDDVDVVIPGNDDSIRSIRLVAGALSDAVQTAYHAYESQRLEREDLERVERERLENIRRETALRRQSREPETSRAIADTGLSPSLAHAAESESGATRVAPARRPASRARGGEESERATAESKGASTASRSRPTKAATRTTGAKSKPKEE